MTDKQGARPQPARKSPPGQGLAQRLGLARKGGRGLIGLQAAADLLRVVEIDRSGRLPRIVNFSSIDPLMDNPAEAADQLLGLLHEKGISTRQVQAVVVDPDAELRQISLPVLAKGEMQALVRRELKKIVPDAAGGELAHDFWYDRSTRKGRKTEVLVGVAPRASVQRILSLMELAGLDTELVTPVPLALITAMGAMGQRYLEKVSAMVHLERDRSFLVIANRGQWVFSRTFPSVLAPEARTGGQPQGASQRFRSDRYLADRERLFIEVNRSLLYFKQRFRGEGVSLAVLSGEAVNLDELAGAFKDNLGVEAAVFAPGQAFEIAHLGERAEKLKRIFPSLALPVGAALQGSREARINYVPQSYRERRRNRVRRLVVSVAAVLVAAGLGLAWWLLHDIRLELEEALRTNDQEQVVAGFNQRLEQQALVTAARGLAETRRAFLARFEERPAPAESLLVALSHLVPDQAVLFRLTLDQSPDQLIELIGEIRRAGMAEADSTMSGFYHRLEDSGLFRELSEPDLAGRYEDDRYVLSFQLTCRLNP